MGAHVLGLAAWNRNMLFKFVSNISESKDWCTYWEINRDDKPAPVDYRNDKEFWYNLPANFDVLDCCWRMYLWTGDRTYIEHPVFLCFYEKTVKDYVERWDLDLEKIMTRARFMNRVSFNPEDPFHICRGIPSYHEGHPGNTQLGVDLLAFQSAAYLAYAEIMDLKGEGGEADIFREKAKDINDFVDKVWWDVEKKAFHTVFGTDGKYSKAGGLQIILLYKDILNPGEKMMQNRRHLIIESPINIELKSHYPETLYRYGAHDEAYRNILELSDTQTRRRDYPEVSYAVVGSIVSGMMGIEPDAREKTVKTLSRLTKETEWAKIDYLPIFGNKIGIRHNGQNETILTNHSGGKLKWIAQFYAEEKELLVNGAPKLAEQSSDPFGNSIRRIKVVVNIKETCSVTVR
jgi:hypothetical protein